MEKWRARQDSNLWPLPSEVQIEAARTVHNRQALLLDKPVANLALPHQLALLDAAQRAAARGVAVLAVLHDLNLAVRYADMLALMNDGAIVACGEPASVQTSRLLSGVFAIDLAVGTTLNLGKSPRHAFTLAHRRLGQLAPSLLRALR
jgi:ABC-type hemin transport system ATPase subunit